MCVLRLLPGISPSGRVQPATTVAVRRHIPRPWIRSVVQTGIQEEGRAAAARRLQSFSAGGSDRFSKSEWRAAGHSDFEKDRKSTRLNSSHSQISYAVFCLKKKKKTNSESHSPEARQRCNP